MIDSFENALNMSNKNSRINPGDYQGKDGLWYCGKCHTQKQSHVVIEKLNIDKYVFHLCKCETEKRDREEREREKRDNINDLQRDGFPEPEMRKWTFANDDMANEKITKAMRRYVDNFAEFKKAGQGLFLYGNTRVGKSYAACEVANALLEKGVPVLVTNFARILNELQFMVDRQGYIDGFNKYALIVIDDLGIERETSFAREQVYNVIDSRYRANLPMIITTNLSMDKIRMPENIDNKRIYDRILERCYPILVEGTGRTQKAAMENHRNMRDILGL